MFAGIQHIENFFILNHENLFKKIGRMNFKFLYYMTKFSFWHNTLYYTSSMLLQL